MDIIFCGLYKSVDFEFKIYSIYKEKKIKWDKFDLVFYIKKLKLYNNCLI